MHVQSKERQEEDETKDEEGEKSAINTKYSDVVIFFVVSEKGSNTWKKIIFKKSWEKCKNKKDPTHLFPYTHPVLFHANAHHMVQVLSYPKSILNEQLWN